MKYNEPTVGEGRQTEYFQAFYCSWTKIFSHRGIFPLKKGNIVTVACRIMNEWIIVCR